MKIEKTNRNEILDFYIKFSEFTDMSNVSFMQKNNDSRQRALRQIKAFEIQHFQTVLTEEELNKIEDIENVPSADNFRIFFTNQTTGFLSNKLSPIVKAKNGDTFEDQNKLFLALCFLKVYFEDKDCFAYFPLLMIDITEEKERLYSESKKTGFSFFDLNFKKDLKVNEEVINFFFDISFEESGSNQNEYLASNLDCFIPEDYRTSTNDMLNYMYDFFKSKLKPNIKWDIMFPNISNDNSAAAMFFASKSSFKSRQEFSLIKEEKAPLVTEYLDFTQEKNNHVKINDSIYWGSLTRDYPLGQGQAIVLQENQSNKNLIPVVGGPGTGKTTLFLSAISNEVTKRAMSLIFDNKDYNNMILVTSTSNKAIENVYKSLKAGFKQGGFCYVGGNTTNRIESAQEVAAFISKIDSEVFSQEKLEKSEASVIRMVDYIQRKEKGFKEVKAYKKLFKSMNVKDYYSLVKAEEKLLKELDSVTESDFEKTKSDLKKIEMKISTILNTTLKYKEILVLIENGLLANLEILLDKINNNGIFKQLFKSNDKILSEYKDFKIKDKETLEVLVKELNLIELKKDSFQDMLNLSDKFKALKDLSMFIVKYEGSKKSFDIFLKTEAFGEYFRTNLFSLNYKLYISSLNYLHQVMLKKKDDVIKALVYLAEPDNQFQYLIDNFGTKKENVEEFLKLVSLAYPVVTSTLAAINNMFPGIQPKNNTVYNTILSDESGMIAANDIIPAFRRANRAIVVGDPKQLAPIISIEESFLDSLKENFSNEFWNRNSPSVVSAFHRAAGTIEGGFMATGRGIILDEHRRCSPQIAELFIKVAEYSGLKVCTPVPKGQAFKNIKEQGLMFFDIKNPDQKTFKKINEGEIEVINTLIKRFISAGYNPKKDIGIITPYKDQEATLIKRFSEILNHNSNEEAKIGTVHKFQGVEYKVVIFSTVISREHDSLSFINIDPSLINVAVSRAKECFVTVGDFDKLTKDKKKENYIGVMSEHIKKHGLYTKMKG